MHDASDLWGWQWGFRIPLGPGEDGGSVGIGRLPRMVVPRISGLRGWKPLC